ncbi:hypothetical protein ACFPYL_14450, partial [Nocardioides hankookensis]
MHITSTDDDPERHRQRRQIWGASVESPVTGRPVHENWPEMRNRATPEGVALFERMSGGVLLSHNLSVAVPSALKGLT